MRTPTGETPFKLAYGSEAVIPVEAHMANHRAITYRVSVSMSEHLNDYNKILVDLKILVVDIRSEDKALL